MNERLATCALVVGCLALAGSVSWAFLARSPESRELRAAADAVQSEFHRLRNDLAAVRRDIAARERRVEEERRARSAAERQLEQVILSEPRLAGDVAATTAALRARIAALEREIASSELFEDREELATPSPAQPPAQPAEKTPVSEAVDADATPRELEERLQRFRSAITMVVSSNGQIATGLVVGGHSDRVYVLTVAAAVPHGSDVTCLFQVPKLGDDVFEPVPFDVVYRDARSELVLLEAPFKTSSGVGVLAQSRFEKDAPQKGDALYAVGAHAVGLTAFTGSVFDGIVSSVENSNDAAPTVRATLPVNEGALGSVVSDAKGKVVGILWRSAAGLERVSTVLLIEATRPVLERLRQHVLVSNFGSRAGGDDDESSIDYRHEASIDLVSPLGANTDVIPGPDDLVLIWDRDAPSLRAYRSGEEEPEWSIGGEAWSAFAYRPWQPYGFLSAGPRATVVVNTRNGKPKSRLAAALSQYFSQAWATFPMGNTHVLAFRQGLGIANLETGRAFTLFGLKATLMAHVDDLLTMTTADGNVGWFTQRQFLTVIARVDKLHAEIERILRDYRSTVDAYRKVSERRRQIMLLSQQLSGGVEVFEVPGGLERIGRAETSFCHVPGTYLHIVGRNVWKIGPTDVVKHGRLEPLWHRTFPQSAESAKLVSSIAIASPDGRYAVTTTHIYDLDHLEAIAELPFRSGRVGFTSSGQRIYAYDEVHRRLVFLRLDELIGTHREGSGTDDDGAEKTKR